MWSGLGGLKRVRSIKEIAEGDVSSKLESRTTVNSDKNMAVSAREHHRNIAHIEIYFRCKFKS